MDNLEPGHYTFEVHYQSSSSISVEADKDYQTAILRTSDVVCRCSYCF